MERGGWIGWRVHEYGYTVRVYDSESNQIDQYDAGNHRNDSAAYVERGNSARLPKGTLRHYARQTAQEMAAELGIALSMVHQEEEEAD